MSQSCTKTGFGAIEEFLGPDFIGFLRVAMSDSATDSRAAALLDSITKFVSDSHATHPGSSNARADYVSLILRVAEAPTSLILMTHEGKQNSLFLPGGAVEPTDSSELSAVRRELAEETGFVLPTDVILHRYRVLNLVRQNEPITQAVYVADVPLAEIYGGFRDVEVARSMATALRAQSRESDVNIVDMQCPICPDVRVPIYDRESRVRLSDCFSYGILVKSKDLRDVLLSPGESRRVGRFPMRYNLDESPVLSVMLELLSKDQPAAELIPVVKPATTYVKPATTVHTSDLVKLLPKLPTVDGTDHRTLLHQLDSAAHQLATRQIDPESPQGATIFTGCFTGTLASWFAQQYKDRTFSGITEVIDIVKSGYLIKDYKGEALIKLVTCKQRNNLGTYIRVFNEHLAYWKGDLSFEFTAYLFMFGISNVSLRTELMRTFRDSKADQRFGFASLTEIQESASRSALTLDQSFLDTSNPTTGRNPKRARDTAGDGDSHDRQSGGKPSRGRGGGTGGRHRGVRGGGSGGRKGGRGPSNRDGTVSLPKAEWDAFYKKACDQWKPDELQKIRDEKNCMGCGKSGHSLKSCPTFKPK